MAKEQEWEELGSSSARRPFPYNWPAREFLALEYASEPTTAETWSNPPSLTAVPHYEPAGAFRWPTPLETELAERGVPLPLFKAQLLEPTKFEPPAPAATVAPLPRPAISLPSHAPGASLSTSTTEPVPTSSFERSEALAAAERQSRMPKRKAPAEIEVEVEAVAEEEGQPKRSRRTRKPKAPPPLPRVPWPLSQSVAAVASRIARKGRLSEQDLHTLEHRRDELQLSLRATTRGGAPHKLLRVEKVSQQRQQAELDYINQLLATVPRSRSKAFDGYHFYDW